MAPSLALLLEEKYDEYDLSVRQPIKSPNRGRSCVCF